jgi:nucleotide-binding universal stress UspA family protein
MIPLRKEMKFPRIKKILVSTDFSDSSEHAVDYAAMIAKAFKADIILLHVAEAIPHNMPDRLVVVKGWPTLQKIAQVRLNEARKRLVAKGFMVKAYLTLGTPYRDIVEKAAKEKADMIVMGTHGRRGVNHLLLGSVAEKVVRLAGCPVVTVRLASGSRKITGPKQAKKSGQK